MGDAMTLPIAERLRQWQGTSFAPYAFEAADTIEELVEALREMVNVAHSLVVAFNYSDPESHAAIGEARTLLGKIGGNQ